VVREFRWPRPAGDATKTVNGAGTGSCQSVGSLRVCGAKMRLAGFTGKIPECRIAVCTAAIALSLVLGGCVETMTAPVASVEQSSAQSVIAPLPGISPSGAKIAFAGLAGAPESIRKAMSDAMTAEVAARKLTLATPYSAHYLIRGNISVYPAGKGTEVAWVWDVYDARKKFRHRLTDSLTLPAVAQDGWSLVTQQHVADIATRSARDIAAYMTHTPEAIAASGKSGTASANRATQALGYAPLR
jgi:hypothetical protein